MQETKTHIHNRVGGIVLHHVALIIEGCSMCMPNVHLKKYMRKHHRSSRVGEIGFATQIGIVQLICRPYPEPIWKIIQSGCRMHMFPHDFSLWCLMFASFDNSINDLWIADKTHVFKVRRSHPMLPAVKPFVGQMDLRWDSCFSHPPCKRLHCCSLQTSTLSLQFSMFFLGVTSPDLTTLTRSSHGELQVRAGDGAN